MKSLFYFSISFFLITKLSFSQGYKVLESTSDHIKIEFDYGKGYRISDTVISGKKFQLINGFSYPIRTAGEPMLPAYYVSIGIPAYCVPKVKIISVEKMIYGNKFIIPVPHGDSAYKPLTLKDLDKKIYSQNILFPFEPANIIDDYFYRYARIIVLSGAPFQFNPVTKELIQNKKIVIEIDFGKSAGTSLQSFSSINDSKSFDFLKASVINKNEAVKWIADNKPVKNFKSLSSQNYWYNPNKSYYKIYVRDSGLYRINYDQLIAAGVQINNVPLTKLEMFNDGEEIPLYIYDSNNDGLFNSGDYIEFVGFPAAATPYARMNIYNNDNVYFFSTQADSSGLRYTVKDGYPYSWDYSYQTSYTKLHFEKDSLFENLGYAGDDHRDFWLWDDISAANGTVVHSFSGNFDGLQEFDPDSGYITIRVQMQGLTTNTGCGSDHNAYISLTGQPVGNILWSGQNTATFEKTIKISNNDFHMYPTGNLLQARVTGDACPSVNSDEVAINWFELEYWKDNRADTNHYEFSSPSNVTGKIKFWTWRWGRDSILIFIPQKNELIKNAFVVHDDISSIIFVDSVSAPTDYFCAGYDYYLSPDSIIKSEQSDLRNLSNGADYIIIAHPDFQSVAERLANFRKTYFPDSSITNPRVKIVYVNQIYNEFSNGLLDPFSVQNFVQYAFYNWQKPSPSYVVLLGDMSHDYRHLLTTSRPSFVPSIPYYTDTYGEGVSDNMIVAVSGNDVHPDLAIGRLSCETVAEGNVLLDKIINYPQDNSKDWKRNVLLLSSGLSQEDEDELGLNDASVQLEQSYLVPNGYKSTKVMRYPNRPEYDQYQGGGPEIRDQINNGAVLVNYYGHGGGYQWDLTFTNDDIYQLNNGGRLPLILSLTCYTAHFDDQDVFGEQFNKVPGKGSVGFFGNTGLTYWEVGVNIDNLIFDQIFDKKNFIVGKVFQNVMNLTPAIGYNTSQIALLAYLGDPLLKLAIPDKPDFQISSPDISFDKDNAVINDTVQIKIKVQNLGIVFPNDSVTIQLYVNAPDTSYEAAEKKLGSFGLEDSLIIIWKPDKPDLYTLTVNVNKKNSIPEMDYSDNSATTSFAVYNLNNPDIIYPVDGYSTKNNFVDFGIADIGYYSSHPLTYYIQVDTTSNFENPVSSPVLSGPVGLISWRANNLKKGICFWRARIFDGKDSSSWSQVRTFSITNTNFNGYFFSGKQLGMYNSYNMNLIDSGLVLNTNYLPPKPDNVTFIEDIIPGGNIYDTVGITSMTTDGKYLYFGYLWYYSLKNNSGGFSKIYKIGTGFNGTIKGQYYGAIPNFYAPIRDAIFFYRDGYIYVATGNPYSLLRVDRNTGDTVSVNIPQGMMRVNDSKSLTGSFYLAADSNYVYNITVGDGNGGNNYLLRIFDPAKNWSLVKPDLKLASTSYTGFVGFFAADGYIYPYENYESGLMRRIRISDGVFEEEWITYTPFQGYFAWCYDWVNNYIYASVYTGNANSTKISKFKGRYLDASGNVTTNVIGPAKTWTNLSYSIQSISSSAAYNAALIGLNSSTKIWDTLKTNLPVSYSLTSVDSKRYEYIQTLFNFHDSSHITSSQINLKSVSVAYSSLPDISISNDDLLVSPDSVLQGLPINVKLNVHNNGLSSADSAVAGLYLNSSGSPFYSKTFSLPTDSSVEFSTLLQTTDLSLINNITAAVTLPGNEFYLFNNTVGKRFYIARDSIKPTLQITFDGREIINGDIISAKPKVQISLKDTSPLPLDTTDFSIVVDNEPFTFSSQDVKFSYSPYPNSQAVILWTPQLADGRHTIDLLAKDASGNYNDTTAAHIYFYVYNEPDIIDVYNYPDPFRDNTNFTFDLTGSNVPDELRIKVYTIAGRLIREITVPPSGLRIGFNKVFWDGRDQDGDNIANGVYFYKIIYKNGDVVKSVIQKLARVR